MGIAGIETFFEANSEEICIRSLAMNDSRNVIVVDGNLFYDIYLFKRLDWVLGGIFELNEAIRKFVQAFKDLNVELIFVFSENIINSALQHRWIRRRSLNVKHSLSTLRTLSSPGAVTLTRILGRDKYPHGPIDLKWSVIEALKELNCDINCFIGNRSHHIASLARASNCLAVLSQNSEYVFYEFPAKYLSLKHLSLEQMTTLEYNADALASALKLERNFFPLLATLLGENEELRESYRKEIKNAIHDKYPKSRFENYCTLLSAYINENYDVNQLDNVQNNFRSYFNEENANRLISDYTKYRKRFGFETEESDSDELNSAFSDEWNRVTSLSRELYQQGKINGKICLILFHQCYIQHTILEDFNDLPSSGLVYKPLRQKMYGILLHEAPPDIQNIGIKEWYMQNTGCPQYPFTEEYQASVDTSLHPGIYSLWNSNDANLNDNRWQLFVSCISQSMDFNQLRNLPQHLIITTAVLHFLCHEAPKNFEGTCYRFLNPWEIEVFIAVAVMLPTKKVEDITKIKIQSTEVRAIKLCAYFMLGCQLMHMLAQICGLVIKDGLFHYFDGKLFHNVYEKVMWRPGVGAECFIPEELRSDFGLIKELLALF